MEITIFRRNEVVQDYFKNQVLYKKEKYINISSLKDSNYGNFSELDETKSKLDVLDKHAEYLRRAAAKYLHEYELVKILCKKQVISRAYFKLYEIIYFEPIITKLNCDSFCICEAPGGFIECITDIRRKKNLQTRYLSISINDPNIKYGNYFEKNNLLYGDITETTTLDETISEARHRFPYGLDLITADGGFDVKLFEAQEIFSSKLLLCEIYLGLKIQKVGGMFIIKFFDMFSHNTIIYYLLLCSFYDYVKIIKPKSSRNCNSERYLVCCNFKGQTEVLNDILEIIKNYEINNKTVTKVYPDFDFTNLQLLKKLTTFNNIILYEQIKTINESIKMIHKRDTYFQNLLLCIFIDKSPDLNKLYNVLLCKHILASRIIKCIKFLRTYNINNYIGFKIN